MPDRAIAWRAVAVAASALLSVAALAPSGPGVAAWFALVPLLLALRGAARWATVAMAVSYTIILGVGSVTPWLAPAAALYFGLGAPWAIAVTVGPLATVFAAHGLILGILLCWRPWHEGAWSVVWVAALWSAWEGFRLLVYPYYPAALLWLSQSRTLPIVQVASLGGTAAITFVLVVANVGIAALLASSSTGLARRLLSAGTAGAIVIGACGFGFFRLRAAPPVDGTATTRGGMPLRVALVDVTAETMIASDLERYLAASRTVRAGEVALVVWPESALTADLERDRAVWGRVSAFVDVTGTPLLAGGPGSARRTGAAPAAYNSMHLVAPAGGLSSYHKRRLLAFAEDWPDILGAAPAGTSTLIAGTALPIFTVPGARFGVLICFEIADADGARSLAARGADFIVNPTNDAWFPGGAPHAAFAVFRAAETGLPVVRAANAGWSGVIDPFGRFVAARERARPPVVLVVDVPAAQPTIGVLGSRAFLAGCVIVIVIGVVASAVAQVRPHGNE
jgi:apolipoprotein N-acyltransferase